MEAAIEPRWARRAVTIPLLLLSATVALALSPLTACVALGVDVARRLAGGRPFATLRALTFLHVYLFCEVIGVAAAAAIWVRARLRRASHAQFLAANFALQRWWTGALWRTACRVFAFDVRVEGEDTLAPGPILLLMRHSSVADTVLPGVFVSGMHGVRLRYVLKRELLADPCLDVVGLRLRNHFVRRDSRDPAEQARQIAAVGALADGLADDEGVLIYPEGTRFSPQVRARRLERMRSAAEPLLVRAEALAHVLPPQLGGATALLERMRAGGRGAVVFCAHAGFEGAARLSSFFGGALIDAAVSVSFRRVPVAQIPADRDALVAWLYDEWTGVDGWVGEAKGRVAGGGRV